MPDDLHWPDGETLLRFLAGDLPGAERERLIAHMSRCDVCRSKLVSGWDAVLDDPSPSEREAFALAHPEGVEAAAQSLLQALRQRDRRTEPRLRPRPSRSWASWMAVAAAVLLLVSPMLRPPSLENQTSQLVDVGVADNLDGYATDYPLQVWGSLRLAQSFVSDERAVRRAGEPVHVDAGVRRKLSRAMQELQMRLASDGVQTRADSVAHYNALGHLLLAEDRLADAEKSYEAAQELAPDNATALVGRAIVLHRRSQADDLTSAQRQRLLERADAYLALVPSESVFFEHALYNRAEIALDLGHVEQALKFMQELARRDESSGTRGVWTERLRQEIESRSLD